MDLFLCTSDYAVYVDRRISALINIKIVNLRCVYFYSRRKSGFHSAFQDRTASLVSPLDIERFYFNQSSFRMLIRTRYLYLIHVLMWLWFLLLDNEESFSTWIYTMIMVTL